MSGLHLRFLGPSRICRDEAVVSRLRSKKTWELLAILALENRPHRREALAERLWREGDDRESGFEVARARSNLRVELAALRTVVGKTALFQNRETTWLAPGFTTDVQQFRTLQEQAARSNGKETRLALLTEAAAHIEGLFLEGCYSRETFGWIEAQREILRRECADVLRLLAAIHEERGDLAAAGESALRLLYLDSDDETGQRIAARLPRTLLGTRRRRTPLDERLRALDSADRQALSALAVLKEAFTPEIAEALCLGAGSSLDALTRSGLLDQEGEHYRLPEAIRQALARRLTGEQRKRLRHRLRRYFQNQFVAADGYGNIPDWYDRFRRDASALQQAIDLWIGEPPTCAGVVFLSNVWHWWGEGHYPEGVATLARAIPYLIAATESLTDDGAPTAAEVLAQMAMGQGDFGQAVAWLQMARERFGWIRVSLLQNLLVAAHHAPDDTVFDQVAPIALSFDPPEGRASFHAHIGFLVAENRMARCRFEEALNHNAQAFALRQELGHRPEELSILWNQRALILAGLERHTEAETAWDRALAGFEATGNRGGVAECYQQLGARAAQRGQVGLGLSLIQQAIALFAEIGNAGAVAASKGTLGELHAQQGQTERARQLFTEGLAFWEASGHPRWVQCFRNRLDALGQPNDK